MKLNKLQASHYEEVIKLKHTLYLLEGGPGTGKTFVTAKLIKHFTSLGHEVVCMFPSHKAKYVAIEQLKEASLSVSIKHKVIKNGTGASERSNDIKVDVNGSEVAFKTIHSFLGIRPAKRISKRTNKLAETEVQMGEVITITNMEMRMERLKKNIALPVIYMVDEVSMVADYMLSVDPEDEDLAAMHKEFGHSEDEMIKRGLVEIIDPKGKGIGYVIHFSGDFNQLQPVKNEDRMPKSLLHGADTYSTVLEKNYRAKDAPDIVRMVDEILAEGKMPHIESESITYLTDMEEFRKSFVNSLIAGDDVCHLSFTNKRRTSMETYTSKKTYDSEDIIHNESKCLAAETKTDYISEHEGKELVLYSGEKVTLRGITPHALIVSGTEWATHLSPVKLRRGTVVRSDGSISRYHLAVKGALGDYTDYIKFVESFIPQVLDMVRHYKKKSAPYHEFQEGTRNSIDAYGLLDDYFYCESSTIGDLFERYWHGGGKFKDAEKDIYKYLKRVIHLAVEAAILEVKSDFAMTCHTAQGSGFDKVYLDHTDFEDADFGDYKLDEGPYKRLLYVGASRAKLELVILL